MKKIYAIILLVFIGTIVNAQYTKLLDFSGVLNGSNPNMGSLISDGTFLYGMTPSGGANDMGVIFKIKPDGTGYVNLLNFSGTVNGSYPRGSLISDGTFLYGMTYRGGTNDMGVIFKIKLDGTGYVNLLDFAGASNGSNPFGSLISDGTFLYGMTGGGGSSNKGTVFIIKPDGTGYSKLLDFSGATNGAVPSGSLISDGTFLYGTTQQGGTNSLGVLFKIKSDGTGYVKLLDFAGTVNGSYAYGSLISDGVFLYGMTYYGGTNDKGVIFKIMFDGTGYSILLDFDGSTNGGNPRGSLISDGTFLYGMTEGGGANSLGTVFKYQYCASVTFSQSLTLCAEQGTTVGSNTYTISGTYYDTLTSYQGCDSMVITNLTILSPITDSITIVPATCGNNNGNVSVAPSGGSGAYTFLWSNSDTTSTVTGLTGQPTDTLVVTITDTNGCTLTDTAIVNCIISTGTNQIADSALPFTVYPNPSNGIFVIQTSGKISKIEILNVLGEKIYQSEISNREPINLSQQPKGIYFIEMKMGEKIYNKKLVIQ